MTGRASNDHRGLASGMDAEWPEVRGSSSEWPLASAQRSDLTVPWRGRGRTASPEGTGGRGKGEFTGRVVDLG